LGFPVQVSSVEMRLTSHYRFIDLFSFIVISNKPLVIDETSSIEPHFNAITNICGW
jgi:hypothetical protein